MKVVLAAEESAGLQAFRLLQARGGQVVAVFASEPRSELGGGLQQAARRAGVLLRPAAELRDSGLANWLRDQSVDLLLNVHSLHIIPAAVLAAVRVGAFNLHPGLLPEFAGLHCATWAIHLGATEHGVTLHWMTAGIDTGDIAYQQRLPIGENDTALTLNAACVRSGLELLGHLLSTIQQGAAIPRLPQDLRRRRYFGRQRPGQGLLQWQRPAIEVLRQIRACDYVPFPSPIGHPECRRADGSAVAIAKASSSARAAHQAPGTVECLEGGDALVATTDLCLRVQLLRMTVPGASASFVNAAKILSPGEVLSDGAPS